MTLRIQDGDLLIDSGSLANSADCCCDGGDCCPGIVAVSNQYTVSGITGTDIQTVEIAEIGTTTIVASITTTTSNMTVMNHSRTLARVDPCCGVDTQSEIDLGDVNVQLDASWPTHGFNGGATAGSTSQNLDYTVSVSTDPRTPSSFGVFSGPFPACPTEQRIRFFATGGRGQFGISGTPYERRDQFSSGQQEFPGAFDGIIRYVTARSVLVSTNGGPLTEIFSPALTGISNFLFEADRLAADPAWWRAGLCKTDSYSGEAPADGSIGYAPQT